MRASVIFPTMALALTASACDGEVRPPAREPATEAPAPTPQTPAVSPVLKRIDLLALAAEAASAAAAGQAPGRPEQLDGRRFSLRIAFGCGVQTPPPPGLETAPRDGQPRWDAADDDIRLSLSPADWSQGDLSGPAPAGFSAIDGVWINEPWMRHDGCPALGPVVLDAAGASPSPLLGLAMLRPEQASRLGQANAAGFVHVVRGSADTPSAAPPDGYRLVIEGRLSAWAEGRVIRCRVERADRQPPCVIGAVVDRLAFEDANQAVLSEWRPG